MLYPHGRASRVEYVGSSVVKISIHPLFFAAGIAAAIFGGLPVFIIYTLTALVHECGHIFCAHSMGFSCERVKLMPYGAAAECEIDGISPADEIKLSLAGPLVNAAICVFLAGLWWFYPITYAYTDTVMAANAVTFLINILPAYPLDGGRVARCLLVKIMPERAANIVLRGVTVLVAIGLASLFFFTDMGINCISFGLFLLCSAFSKPPVASKINFAENKKLKRGLEVKYILADRSLTYRRAVRFLDDKKYVVFRTPEGDEVTQDELFEGFERCGVYDKVFGNTLSEESGCAADDFEEEERAEQFYQSMYTK